MASRRKNPHPHQSSSQASRRARLAAEQQAAARAKKRNRIITAVAAGVVLLMIGVGVVLQVRSSVKEPPTASAADVTVREDSHRLSDVPDGKVTFVEFLDFECEACGAAFPAVEQLRAAYGDRVSFVVRYFPLDGHFNAQRAARAVEAAAQQDQFEAMYEKMYETQAEGGVSSRSRWTTCSASTPKTSASTWPSGTPATPPTPPWHGSRPTSKTARPWA